MTEEHTSDSPVDEQPEPIVAEQAEEPEAEEHTGDAWHDVMAQLDALGEAMGRWARAATSDPQNRDRARELKEHMKKMADTVEGAVDEAASSDVAQSFRDAAAKTGEAFRAASDRVAGEVSPRVAGAFRTTAEKLHQAAERMESKTADVPAGAPPNPPAGVPPQSPAADTESSVTDDTE